MSEEGLIRFDRDVTALPDPVRIGFTQTAFDQMSEEGNPEEIMMRLSSLPRFLITPRKAREEGEETGENLCFTLNAPFGCFFCTPDSWNPDAFSALKFWKTDLYSQNMALRYGLIFEPEEGISAEVLLGARGIAFKYVDGVEYGYDDEVFASPSASRSVILSELERQQVLREEKRRKRESPSGDAPETDTDVPDELEEIFRAAEQYARIDGERETERSQENGRVAYRAFRGVPRESARRTACEFALDKPEDRNAFREGDLVEIEDRDGNLLPGEIEKTDSTAGNARVTVLFRGRVSPDAVPSFGWMRLSASSVCRDVQLEALGRLRSGKSPAGYLRVLFGKDQPAEPEEEAAPEKEEMLFRAKEPLSQSQREAVRRGILTKDAFLVMGPPGTGKTAVICEWVRYFVNVEHKRVLISSQNNPAVDNVLARLAGEESLDMIRVGSEARVSDEVIPFLFEERVEALGKRVASDTARAARALADSLSEWEEYRKKREEGDEQVSRPACPGYAHLFERVGTDEEELRREEERAWEVLKTVSEFQKGTFEQKNTALGDLLLENVSVVGATCIGACSRSRFADLDFDVTILDEAGQIQVQNALVPLSVSPKVLMLGDHRQLPPRTDPWAVEVCRENGVDEELLRVSLFEKLYTSLPSSRKMMLDTQYRMPGQIADVLSGWFYNDELHTPDALRGGRGMLPALSPAPFVLVDTSGCPGREEEKTGTGWVSALEAEICVRLIKAYLAGPGGADPEKIGVLSAYRDQVSLIRDSLAPILGEEAAREAVSTVDRFQGQERDLILYSFVRSSGSHPQNRRIGFLSDLRRLNVAMSRCRRTLVLIGDFCFLSRCEHQEKDEKGEPVYENSEKQFSVFLRRLIHAARGEGAELVPYEEMIKRLGE